MKTYVVGTHKKRLAEALLMSTHIICFRGEIRKISTLLDWKSTLTRAMVPKVVLTLILLNNLVRHTHFWLSANQITSYNVFVQIHKLNDKQCRSWSDGFFWSHLIWIYTVCKGRSCHEQHYKVNSGIFNDRFDLSFFVAMRGFRERGFDSYWSLYLSAQKRRPCVDISTPLRYQQKVVWLVLDPWFKSSYEPLRKLALIHVRTTKAQISLRVCADWSAPLFFAVARFVFFFFEGEASHKFKWKAKWFSGMYKFLI